MWGNPQETQFAQSAFTTVARLLGDKPQEKKPPVLNFSDPKEFRQLFLDCGFSTVKIRSAFVLRSLACICLYTLNNAAVKEHYEHTNDKVSGVGVYAKL